MKRKVYKFGIDPNADEAERLPLFADQIRGDKPPGVESAREEEKNDETETDIKSIRQGEVREPEGSVSAPSGRGDRADSARRGGGGETDVRGDGGGRGRPLDGEGADIERPEPADDTRTRVEAEERPEYVDEADPSRTEAQPPSAARKPDNYAITDLDTVVPSGKKSKLDANLAAIRLLKELQAEGRAPAREEQDILGKFVGWGQFPDLFNEINEAGQKLAEERKELKSLLGEREYERAKRSTLNAHYTSPQVVQKIWDIVRKLGFKGGRTLEPSMGVGYFYGLMPRDLMAQSKLAGVELDPTTGAIARMLYPNVAINVKGFQEVKIADGFYDLVIGNLPFGDFRVHDPAYDKYRANIHDYFILKSLDKTRPGGIVAVITSTGTLDKADSKIRKEIAGRGDLVAAMRFPESTFEKTAGTAVVTDLLIFRRWAEGEKAPGEKTSSDYLPASLQLQGKGWYESARQRLDENGEPIHGAPMETKIDRIQYQYEWKEKEQPPDSDIRSLRARGWSQESQNVWVTPLVKNGPSSDWTKLGELPDPDGGEPIPINNYYVRNPEMILGRLDRKSRMYRGGEPHVSATDDFAERFNKAIASLPENIFGERQTRATEPEAVADAMLSNVVEGGYILRDGRILQRQGEAFVIPDFTPAEEVKAKLLIPVRDALNALNAAQLKGEDTADLRRALNRTYDLFVFRHGPIRKATNAKLLTEDPSSYLLLALETSYDPKRQKATKADIFTKDTIARARQAGDVSTPAAAIAVNLFESGCINVSRIAELLKVTPEEAGGRLVADGLAYENPRGTWETAEGYLSGNVRKKLIEAREAADVESKYWPNVEALEKVQPADVPMDQISVKLGAGWVPAEDIKNFAGHLMQTDPRGFYIEYSEVIGIWSVGWGTTGLSRSSLAREVYGTDRADFMDVLESALNDRPIRIYDRIDKENVFNKDASDAANEKVREVREQFADWLWTDDERARRLHRYYNDNFNNMRVIEYTGAHYANNDGKFVLPGMNPAIALRPNQIKDVWQAVANGKLLDASEVGAGKTFILGAIAMEWKRLGMARKPAIAVPKPRIAATVAELQLLYPAAKILSLEKSFDKENRKRTTAMMATGDYDMIVLSHEQLDKMPMSPDVAQEFIGAELEEIEERIKDAQAAASEEGDSRAGNRIVKHLEKIKERVEAKLQEALDATNKDDVIYFEQTGIDALLVDEAHAFKSLPVYSRRSEIKGVPSTRSDRATSMYMRTRWLMRQNNNKGAVFATGTPVTNTLAEVYNMQRYLQPELLEERGIESFDAWANLFADVATDFEYTASGEYKPVSRMTEFVNLPELQQMIRQIMATNFVDDMTWVARPKKIENVITSPMTEEQLAYLQKIQERVERLKHMSPKERKESGENYLLISTDARKSALSPRLVNPRATASGGKIEKVAEKVLEIHRERPDVTQMIFLDYGVNANAWGYSVYDDLQTRLIAGGIPKERIANFGRMSDGARQGAAEKLNAGKYLIGIGSSGRMGTGINAQKRLAAMHHVDAPWLPAFVEQRNGRGHRQGNLNDPTKPAEEQTVEAYYYTTEGSFDVVMWQALTRKSNFIREFMRGDMSVREMRMDDTGDEETGEIGPEMILAATSGNPYELDRVKLIKDIERLERQARNHRQQQSRFRTRIAEAGRMRAELEQKIARYEADAAQYEATKGQKFSATFNGKTYDDRKVAGNQLAVASVETPPRSHTKIGQYRGFDLYVEKDKEKPYVYLTRSGERYHFALDMSEPEGAFNSADANLRHAAVYRAKAIEDVAALEREVETAKAEVDKPFKRAEELEEKRLKLREIQGKIEEMFDQKPGRDVRKLAGRLETLEPVMSLVRGDAYDIAEIRQSMADVAPNKAAFDRWLLALQNAGIVRLYERDDIESRGDPQRYVRDPETGRYYGELTLAQGWEPKAANVPPITAFIEAEAQADTPTLSRITDRMEQLSRTPSSPVEISTLRAEFSNLSKEEFDAAMLRLAEEERIALRRHDYPASLSEDERDRLIKIGDGYFVAATFREGRGRSEDEILAPRDPNILASVQRVVAPTFYSQVERAIERRMPNRASGEQALAILKNPRNGVKASELDWLGVEEWLADKETVTKRELLDFARANRVEIQEVVKGGAQYGTDDNNVALRALDRGEPVYWADHRGGEPIRVWDRVSIISRESAYRADVDAGIADWLIGGSDTRYSAHTLPGGKNHRELLLTMPEMRSNRPPERITELPDGYEVGVDPSKPPDARWHILPPGQVSARPFYGSHPSREAAIASAVERINFQRQEEWERNRPSFQSSHWDEPNVLAHIRFNERTDADGKRTLFIEEIQSDFAQEGRKNGFKGRLPEGWKIEEEQRRERTAYVVVDERGHAQESSFDRQTAINEATRQGVPDMPFKSTESWAGLAIKRVLRWAVENGYDRVAWTTGETQAERYDLSKHIDRLKALEGRYSEVRGTEGYEVTAWKDGREVISKRIPRDELPDLIGKEMAEKVVAQIEANKQQPVPKYSAEFVGLDLKVGGEGMKGFYDQILPSFVNRYVKKWGAKVERGGGPTSPYGFDIKESRFGGWNVLNDDRDIVHTVPTREEAEAWAKRRGRGEQAVHFVEITPQMRESVMQGQPLFAPGKPGAITSERSAYWGTPPIPRDEDGRPRALTPAERAEHFEYSRAEFRRHATRPRLYTNEQGAFTYAAALKKVVGAAIPIAVDGLAVPLKDARLIIDYLRDRAGTTSTPAWNRVYNEMADQLALAAEAAARNGDKALSIVSTDVRSPETGRKSFLAVRQNIAHEEAHVWRMGARLFFSEDVVTSDPDYKQLRRALIKAKYPQAYLTPQNVLDESVAHLAAGRWKDLGYKSEAEGLAYLERVFDQVYTDFGADALRSLRLRTLDVKGARENVISRRSGFLERVGQSRGEGGATQQSAGRETPRSCPSLRGREGERRRHVESLAGEVQGVEPTGRGGRVAWTRADIENSPPTFYSQVERTIEQRIPFIEEALAAGANVDHISVRHHGSDWTVISFDNARGTYLVKGEDVYVTERGVREAQASIEADPVALPGIRDLKLAGDIEIEVSEIRSKENKVEPRGRGLDYSLSM